eukprot:gene10067-11742_t
MEKIPAVFNWSGGKDSTLALHYLLQDKDFEVKYLLTTLSDAYNRVSMHGVREEFLLAQAESIGLPLQQVRLAESVAMEDYEASMALALEGMKKRGIAHAVFGDIFLEDLKVYRERKLGEIGMQAVFPLWKKDTRKIIKEFVELGYKTIVVCAREGLQDFCGRIIDEQFMADLPADVDPCGENGEFHTFAFEGPIFSKPLRFSIGERIFRTFPSPAGDQSSPSGYWFTDLLPYTKS